MNERPNLSKRMDEATFRSYYYLKSELLDFCRKNGLPVSGGKLELTERIASFLATGKVLSSETHERKTSNSEPITESSVIEKSVVCSEKHRAFFVQRIGKSFSFNVPFQKWLKANSGKTYKEAIEAYYQILSEKKKAKSEIDRQFEYNTYIRDFFEDNENKSLKEAAVCWKYKKSLKGHNKYERSDLAALER